MLTIRSGTIALVLAFAFISGGCVPNRGLTSTQISQLTNGQAVGPVAVSSDGSLLAFSDGENIFTLDLTDPNAQPVQLTNGTSAFAPSFLTDGTIVFGTIDPATPDQISLFSLTPGTLNGNPTPTNFGTITATDLGLAAGTTLNVPDQFSINPGGAFGTGMINGEPFLFNFGNSTVTTTPLNNTFGGQIFNPVLSPGLNQIAFTNAAGQVGTAGFNNGVIDTTNTSFFGNGSFPGFNPVGQLTFFGNNGFNTLGTAGGMNTIGLGNPAITPGMAVFAPNGQSFFTNSNGTVVQSTFPTTTFGTFGTGGTTGTFGSGTTTGTTGIVGGGTTTGGG